MKQILPLLFFIIVFVFTNVQAEESDTLKELCECEKTSKYRNVLIKHACLNYCRELSSRSDSEPQAGNGGTSITWPNLPEPPKTNPFERRLPENGLNDLEMYRMGNEIFRQQLEDRREVLEDLRNNRKITNEKYRRQIDIYKSGILDYQDGTKVYKNYSSDIQGMRTGR